MYKSPVWELAIGSLVWATALVACSPAPPPVDMATARNMAFFAEAADRAESSGATAAQVEVLRKAAATGELTPAQVTPLLQPYFECLADFGMVGETEGTMEVGPNVTLPQVVVSYPDMELDTEEQISAVSEKRVACEDEFVGYAWKAIQLAPTTVEAWDSAFAARTPAIIDCIRRNGGSIDDNATVDEIVESALIVVDQTGVSCMSAT